MMSIKWVIETNHGAFVGDLVEETTEVIHASFIPMIGPDPGYINEVIRVTGWKLDNAWFMNNRGDLRFILSSLHNPVANIERTFIHQTIWVNRDSTVSQQEIDTGPSTDWDGATI